MVVKRVAVNTHFLVLKPPTVETERLLIAFDACPVDETIKLTAAIESGKCAPEGRTGEVSQRIVVFHNTMSLAMEYEGVKLENTKFRSLRRSVSVA